MLRREEAADSDQEVAATGTFAAQAVTATARL